jgi:RNA polymerase sigma-70 factor (ECF subfamily)
MPAPTRAPRSDRLAVVRPLPFAGDDDALIAALRAGDRRAVAALIERHATHVLRVLARILGADAELPDLQHDVFVRALGSLEDVRDPSALKGWLSIIAVNTARTALKRRGLRRWLRFLPWEEVPEVEAPAASADDTEALRVTYGVLDRLPREERIAFALRFVEGMELTEVAAATGVSLATAKRRLSRAQGRFLALAGREPALSEWIQEGARWKTT